jgi:DNA-directed RNA polymerase specialized sigma24 family protein
LENDLGPVEWKSEAENFIDWAAFWETFRECLSKLPALVGDEFMLREMEEMETAQSCQTLRIRRITSGCARTALRECLELNWFENKPKLRSDA